MRLFVDDVRKPPNSSWTWARTNIQAQHMLEMGRVTEISLDHDMGGEHMDANHPRTMYFKGQSAHNGVELAEWMILHQQIPERVTIHSWNQEGAERMRNVLEQAGCYASVVPYDPTPEVAKLCAFCGAARHPQRRLYCSDACRQRAKVRAA